jgi:uncharacterized membrane protein
MARGPVEYVIISFPENRFTGEIAPELADLMATGTIRVLDLLFVMKDHDGVVSSFEFDEIEIGHAYAELDADVDGLMSDDDVAAAAEVLAPNSSALLIVWEDLWATPLVEAIRRAGGELVAGERIPHDVVEAAFEGID